MPDLKAIYNAFDADEPLPADDNLRYVDLSKVRGDIEIPKRLALQVKNAPGNESYHLLMGHTKCGKTTELFRAAKLLEDDGYVTVFFDVAEFATRTFEYTTVLLLMAEQVALQLAKRGIKVKGESIRKLLDFLREKEVTVGKELSGELMAKSEAELGSGLLAAFLGKLGFGVEMTGGFQRSREITTKIEADTRGFVKAVRELIADARDKVMEAAGKKGLVVVCDGCDKLAITATDGNGKTHDLQQAFFVDHAHDLRSVPCHVIYTVPLSIAVNLTSMWEQSPAFVPAVPISALPGIVVGFAQDGRRALREAVDLRLRKEATDVKSFFADPTLLDVLIDSSGGHLSDLLLMIRDAVLNAQTDESARIEQNHIKLAISALAREHSRLVEREYLDTLVEVDRFKQRPSNSDLYRAIIARRLVLEYICGNDDRADLHPLTAVSAAYRRHKEQLSRQ
ncbi:MAG: hypothetical protein ACREEM_14155 [Blastocatellia bacterium]